ncbi:hypothetical protein CLV90_1074 [Maribacter spongiicola]|uniref:PIN like domain-containing protein n=2 Tax=Maribacter spongiicola TaxID=1206753 RepID=A0A4R7K6U8_9FLAO|nr:hypothetical protein CLV90_1074 [Maribacter spongiicola]
MLVSMKNEFYEHFKLSETELKELWENATFVFDTNVLLNFYRYSEESKNKFIEKIEELGPRVWYAHHSINEYLKNRLGEIQNQKSLYSDALKDMENLEKVFEHERKHPFITPKLLKKMKSVNAEVKRELEAGKEFQESRFVNDDVRDKLVEITSKKIGESYSEEELIKIYDEGANRYKKSIPPGFKDKAKISANDGSAYGDLIIWKQIIEYAKENKKDVVFITDDNKEDWWLISSGKTVGPRPELIREFYTLTNRKIQFYQPFQFLKFISEFLKSDVKQEIINEVKDTSSYSADEFTRRLDEQAAKIKKMKDAAFEQFLKEDFSESKLKSLNSLRKVRSELSRYRERKLHFENMIENHDNVPSDVFFELKSINEKILRLEISESMLKNYKNQ